MIDVSKLRKLEANATQGPWAIDLKDEGGFFFQHARNGFISDDIYLLHFIRNNAKSLYLELEALREVTEALKKAREEEYCNVPYYVDEAMEKLKKARQG